jgi:hypothetical protein
LFGPLRYGDRDFGHRFDLANLADFYASLEGQRRRQSRNQTRTRRTPK